METPTCSRPRGRNLDHDVFAPPDAFGFGIQLLVHPPKRKFEAVYSSEKTLLFEFGTADKAIGGFEIQGPDVFTQLRG